MSGGSRPSGTQVVQQSSGPWAGQQPYLSDGFAIARDLLASDAANGRPAFYPGETYTPASAMTNAGVGALNNRAYSAGFSNAVPAERAMARTANNLVGGGASGLPGYGTQASVGGNLANRGAAELAGFDTLNATASGDMIGRNPEFQGMVNRAVAAARPNVDAAFAGSNRLGSGAHAAAFSDAATRVAGDLAYQDYGRERGNQLTAANALQSNDLTATNLGIGTLANLTQQDLAARGLGGQLTMQAGGLDRSNIDALLRGGSITEGFSDKALTDEINRFNWNQNLPWTQLQRYMGTVQGNYGSEGSTVQPVYGNSSLSSGLGAAAAGGMVGNMFFPGIGGAVGALGGGLLGLRA